MKRIVFIMALLMLAATSQALTVSNGVVDFTYATDLRLAPTVNLHGVTLTNLTLIEAKDAVFTNTITVGDANSEPTVIISKGVVSGDESQYLQVDILNGILFWEFTSYIDFPNTVIADLSSTHSIDWGDRLLITPLADVSLNWGNRILYDSTGTNSAIAWGARHLTDPAGNLILDFSLTNALSVNGVSIKNLANPGGLTDADNRQTRDVAISATNNATLATLATTAAAITNNGVTGTFASGFAVAHGVVTNLGTATFPTNFVSNTTGLNITSAGRSNVFSLVGFTGSYPIVTGGVLGFTVFYTNGLLQGHN